MQCPRRALLSAVGLTVTAAIAGPTATADDAPPSADADELLAYLPASVDGETIEVSTTDVPARRAADEPHGSVVAPRVDVDDVATIVGARAYGPDRSSRLRVLAGEESLSVGPDDEAETRDVGGLEYELYEDGRDVVATVDGVVLVADSVETIEDGVRAAAGERERLLDAEPALEAGLETFPDADERSSRLEGSYHVGAETEPIDGDDVSFAASAVDVLDPDTIEMRFALSFEDAADATDEVARSLETGLATLGTAGEPDVSVDDELVTVTVRRDLAAERAVAEHESPTGFRVRDGIDPDDEYVDVEIRRGDPTPVEDLTLELGGDELAVDDWAGDRSTVEAGDTIRLPAEGIEPNTRLTVTHEHRLGTSSSSTTLLSHLRFEFAHDADEGTVEVEYADAFPLDGDRLSIVGFDDRSRIRPGRPGPKPALARKPWAGETVTEGTGATVDGVDPGTELLVAWDGNDRRDAVAHYYVRPPGRVSFEYDYRSRRLRATLSLEEERDADEYELVIDGDPADVQWSDGRDTVAGESTIRVDDVAVGTDVEVRWNGDHPIAATRPAPTVELELDPGTGTVTHVGGDALPASELTAEAWADGERVEVDVAAAVDDTFAAGDEVAIDADGVEHVVFRYDGAYVGHATPPRNGADASGRAE